MYSLRLYSPILAGQGFIGEITGLARDWRRSIRLQGGYWLGSFTIDNQPLDVLRQWFYDYRGAHVEEVSGGVTWEGMIYEMDIIEVNQAPALEVTVAGYVHTANWRFATPGVGLANASSWINTILTTDCTTFLSVGRIDTNTLQVSQAIDNTRAWDEMLKVVSLGDTSGNPYRLFCDSGRRMTYEAVSSTPKYYTRLGLRKRWSLTSMFNGVSAVYTDENGVDRTLAEATNAQSIAAYGKRQERLSFNEIPTTAMTAYRDTFLKETGWPYTQPVYADGVNLYSDTAQTQLINPYAVTPGVARDLGGFASRETGGWLSDNRDFIVDEVEVDAEGNLDLRTFIFDESDLLAAQAEELASRPDVEPAQRGKKRKLTKKQKAKRAWERKPKQGIQL